MSALKISLGAGETAWQLKALPALAEDLFWFLEPRSRGSEPTLTPAPRDPVPSFGFLRIRKASWFYLGVGAEPTLTPCLIVTMASGLHAFVLVFENYIAWVILAWT